MRIADRVNKADVAQRKEQGSSKAKVAGSSPAASTKEMTATECVAGEKKWLNNIDDRIDEFWAGVVRKHNARLAYNAAYQRDLRTIKRLGLEMTVAAYRKKKET